MKNPDIGAVQHRDGVINAILGNDEITRLVQLAFSSEAPVERSYGIEILDHSPEAVDMSRLLDGAPLLLGHDPDNQIGVVESARIDSDRVGRATVKLSRSAKGAEIFQDIVDGIRTKVSVGYIVSEYRPGDVPGVYIASRWQPFEVSLVSIPADASVGVGRSQINLPKEAAMPTPETETPAVDTASIRASAFEDARKEELARVAGIAQSAKRHGLQDLGQDFIAGGKSVAEFVAAALEEVSARSREQRAVPATALGMERREVERYSIMKAIRALTSGDWSKAPLEKAASIAVADNLGKEARGFYVPWEIQTRAQNTSTIPAGGALVDTTYLGGSFIQMLRARSVIVGLGARYLTGLTGNVTIPKQTGGSTTYWVGEDEAASDSELTFGLLQMRPRTLAAAVPITRQMMLQGDPSMDSLVTTDISIGMALAMDIALLEGDGFAKPLGITNTAGINTQSVSSAGNPTWAELVGFETKIDSDNALMGSIAYVTTPSVRGALKVTAKDSGSGIFLLDGGVANGYPVATSTQLSQHRIIFGNFADVIIGEWGVLDIMEDKATKVASGGVVIRAFQDVDSAIRHPESFCINS